MEEINIEYHRPIFHRRVLANLIDAMLFALIFVLLFLGLKSVVESSKPYLRARDHVQTVQRDSGLYGEKNGRYYDVVSLYKEDTKLTASQHKQKLTEAIDSFITYLDRSVSAEISAKVQTDYDEYRLGDKMVYEDVPCFILVDGSVRENPECQLSYQRYTDEIYAPYIDRQCQGFLVTEIPGVRSDTRFMSNMLVFVELPVSFIIAALLVYMVPPFIFKRGRRTIGKAIYKIGLVDSRCLNVRVGRTIARFSIFIFGILFLSMLTLGIPMIISFSMMAFSKSRQGFPDYMLNLNEVDISDVKVYNSLDEIAVEKAQEQEKAPDFKMKERL